MRKGLVILSLMFVLFVFTAIAHAEQYGMYVKVTAQIEGDFYDAVRSSENGLRQNGWQVLASYGNVVPEGCTFRAHTIVVSNTDYAQQVLSHGPQSSFAVVQRIGIYEDHTGINSAFVNPASLNRTILGDDKAADLSVSTMNTLSEILSKAVPGNVVSEQIGQIRKKGRVGGMGGGDFGKKVETLYEKEYSPDALREVSQHVKEGINANKKGWKLMYTLEMGDVVIYGVNKEKMESRAYTIAGEKRESDDNRCPGIDHVSAFPIEVIVYKDDGKVKVVTLDGMYRMKVYFEDAGMWAFMKNMAMPGEIEDEIVEMSTALLKK